MMLLRADGAAGVAGMAVGDHVDHALPWALAADTSRVVEFGSVSMSVDDAGAGAATGNP